MVPAEACARAHAKQRGRPRSPAVDVALSVIEANKFDMARMLSRNWLMVYRATGTLRENSQRQRALRAAVKQRQRRSKGDSWHRGGNNMIELLWTYLGAEVGAYCESFDRHLATGILDRTQPNRLDDLILLLRDLELEREHPIPIFLDIAPGLGNLEYPAATALDMARALSRTPVVAFDRPEAVEKFRRNCDRSSHEAVLRQKNLYVLAGDALKPLPPQIEFDLQGRRIPAISR